MAEARNCLSRLAEVPATLPRPSGSAHLVADFGLRTHSSCRRRRRSASFFRTSRWAAPPSERTIVPSGLGRTKPSERGHC